MPLASALLALVQALFPGALGATPVLSAQGMDGGGNRGDGAPVLEVVRAREAPRIDGILDDALWSRTSPITDLRQVEPVAGGAPSERTEVHLAFDEDNIYVALRCYDREPAGIRATQARRDANLDPDDRVELLFDPFLDRRNAFWFQISPAGSKGDALITRNGASFNKQWDGVWYGRARIGEAGWEAELALPVRTLNFDPEAEAWGFNVRRFIRRRNEEVRWASPEPRLRFFEVSQAGTLRGLHGLRKGLGVDLEPFGVVNRSYDDQDTGESADVDVETDLGFDLFYSLSSQVKLSLSVNTDFAEPKVTHRFF